MPTQPTAGTGSFSPGDLPIDLLQNAAHTNSFAAGYVNTFTNAAVCVTSIDMVATNPADEQCFASYRKDGFFTFFYDSQSIGLGGGVYFLWRGLVVLPPGGSIELSGTTADFAVDWSCSAGGVVVPAGIYS